jgi:hypothetical protein
MDGTVRILFTSPYFDDAIVRMGTKEFLLDVVQGLDETPLLEINVAYLVAKRGYQMCGVIFWCIEDAKAFLSTKYVEAYKEAGLPEYTHNDLMVLLKHIDLANASHYLDRIENELLPEGKYTVAKMMATGLHETDSVRNSPIVLARVERILEICGNESE